jgi:hypothetical protein
MCRSDKVYTIGIIFDSNHSKVYEFATKTCYKNCTYAGVKDSYGSLVRVRIMYVREGITERATKWRTGGVVTHAQREEFGIRQGNGMSMNVEKITLEDVVAALDTISELQEALKEKKSDNLFGATPSLSVSRQGELIVSGVSSYILPQKLTKQCDINTLLNFVYEDEAKVKARERLEALEKEAA